MSNETTGMPQGEAFEQNIRSRRTKGAVWRGVFMSALIIALVALLLLLYNFGSKAFGLAATEYDILPSAVSERPLEDLSREELLVILEDNISRGLMRRLENDLPIAERDQADILDLVYEYVLEERVVATWSLTDSLLRGDEIRQEVAEEYPDAQLGWRSWVNGDFLTGTISRNPLRTGIQTALFGSLWMIFVTILVAFPIGVGAAIYLEEYANDTWFNRLIQTNINNLAGVPSIIYGMLGLVIFVRTLEPLTSGAFLGQGSGNGRTILSAGMTMALLILPIIIINAQEAVRAVPRSLRQASYGLGATRWQTIWHHVLPNALPGILTGTILAVSRAIGETAPLIVVGASTYIVTDPDSPFSKFTALPIQIYNWTSRAQPEYQNIAAAAIIVLLILLLSLNSLAVILRNRFSRRMK